MKMPRGSKSSSPNTVGETWSPESFCVGFRAGTKPVSVLGRLKIGHAHNSIFFKYLHIYVEEGLSPAGKSIRERSPEQSPAYSF